jgi:hypothetical protein
MTLTPQERVAMDWGSGEDIVAVVDAMFDAATKVCQERGIKFAGDDRMAKVEANIIIWLQNS